MKIFVYLLVLAAMSVDALEFQEVPESQTVHVGEHAVFSVEVSGTAPYTYAWYMNNEQVGGDSATFTTGSLTLSQDKSSIFCMVSDASGASKVTDAATLRILPVSSRTITLEGDLALTDGTEDFDADMKVLLYSSLTGGDPLYTETFAASDRGSIEVRDGRFQVRLGLEDNGTDLLSIVQANDNLYVEFQVGADTSFETLSPRLPLTAFPYALVQLSQQNSTSSSDN